MSEKKTEVKKKEDDGFRVIYKGEEHETAVYGLGLFHRNSDRVFRDPKEIETAKKLVKSNRNFEEVGSK